MFTTLISFLGGSVFRMVWGEVSAWLTARQEHRFEIDRMELQGRLDAEQHARNLEAQSLQAELGIREIHVKSEADLELLAAQGFNEGVKLTGQLTGVRWVDAWNAAIRPGGATLALALFGLDALALLALKSSHWELIGAFLGIYVADRTLFKRGK